MALLSIENRKKLFKACGLGEYNTSNIKKLQKKYLRTKDVDGKYGTNTDNLLRHIYYVRKYTKNFTPEEFKCGCGGRYCTGYPTYMKPTQLDAMQKVRTHYKKPMRITCGLRCSGYNKALSGSVSNSRHLSGLACDYYIQGVTDTLEHRNSAIKYLKTLENHRYSYGNGVASNGTKPNTPNMGNAIHTDCNNVKVQAEKTSTSETTKAEKLAREAERISWPYGTVKEKWQYSTGRPTDVCKTAMKSRGYDSKIEYSDCGYFQNTIVYDVLKKKVNILKSENNKFLSIDGFKVAYKGTSIKESQLKRGDIVRYKNATRNTQHTLMYLGNGKIAEAGRGTRFGVIRKSTKYTGKKKVIEVLRVVEG